MGLSSLSLPVAPADWWDSVLSAPEAPFGLVGLSPFSPSGTLRADSSQNPKELVLASRWLSP